MAALMSVAVGRANFRAGPSTDEELLFTAERYFPVKVLARRKGWLEIVDVENERAWVAARLLSSRRTVIVKVDRDHVRSGPSLHQKVITKVSYGEAFRVAGRRGRWLRIANHERELGWVRDDLTWGDEQK